MSWGFVDLSADLRKAGPAASPLWPNGAGKQWTEGGFVAERCIRIHFIIRTGLGWTIR